MEKIFNDENFPIYGTSLGITTFIFTMHGSASVYIIA
jgi:hypothetical protein